MPAIRPILILALLNSSHTHAGPVVWPNLKLIFDLNPADQAAALACGPFGVRRQSASDDGAFTTFRKPLPAALSPQHKPKRRGAPLPAALHNAPWLTNAHGPFGVRRQSASVDGALTSHPRGSLYLRGQGICSPSHESMPPNPKSQIRMPKAETSQRPGIRGNQPDWKRDYYLRRPIALIYT